MSSDRDAGPADGARRGGSSAVPVRGLVWPASMIVPPSPVLAYALHRKAAALGLVFRIRNGWITLEARMKRKKKLAALLYDKTFEYTRAADQPEGYLRDKFKRIAAEMAESKRAAEAEQVSKVRKLGNNSRSDK